MSSPPFGMPSFFFEPYHTSSETTSGLRFFSPHLYTATVQQRTQQHCNPCISRARELLKCRTAIERKLQRAQFSLWEMKETKDTSSSLDFWCKEAQKRTPANNESRVPPLACRRFHSNSSPPQVRLQGLEAFLLVGKYSFDGKSGSNATFVNRKRSKEHPKMAKLCQSQFVALTHMIC
jgi:hypothetical protein